MVLGWGEGQCDTRTVRTVLQVHMTVPASAAFQATGRAPQGRSLGRDGSDIKYLHYRGREQYLVCTHTGVTSYQVLSHIGIFRTGTCKTFYMLVHVKFYILHFTCLYDREREYIITSCKCKLTVSCECEL